MTALKGGDPAAVVGARDPRITPGSRADIGLLNTAVIGVLGRMAGTNPPNLFTTLGRNRRLFRGWLRFAGSLMPRGRLTRRQTEMVILRVAHRRSCAYELEHHRRLGAKAGLTSSEIEALGTVDVTENRRWSGSDSVLLRATDQLLDRRDIDDEVWADLTRILDDRRLIELVLLVGHYDMLATTIGALRIAPDRPRG